MNIISRVDDCNSRALNLEPTAVEAQRPAAVGELRWNRAAGWVRPQAQTRITDRVRALRDSSTRSAAHRLRQGNGSGRAASSLRFLKVSLQQLHCPPQPRQFSEPSAIGTPRA